MRASPTRIDSPADAPWLGAEALPSGLVRNTTEASPGSLTAAWMSSPSYRQAAPVGLVAIAMRWLSRPRT